ncbi:MAG: tRNA pseudouridine(38-40) synthase TruA [Rickettsiales bacterium]|jgi:tRNA pseudouridine38-40 synthase|nr:tRNA pseudouridine(38-40) synthase TruA [Rickettsiales bacterium]
MRFRLNLEYNGTGLIGFQKNPAGVSVQSLVEDAVFKFSGERAEVVPCGRTDAGVHAIEMPAHFDLDSKEQVAGSNEVVKKALNFYLANSPVSVVSCECVSDDWHARFGCKGRRYKYVIANQDFPPVLDKEFVWWVPQALDVSAMRAAALLLHGTHDWTSFRAAECQAASPVKTMDKVEIIDGSRIVIEFSARSFLHHQVRNIVGTLVEIGRGKPFDINAIFNAKSRAAAGPTAPASGLFFVRADY